MVTIGLIYLIVFLLFIHLMIRNVFTMFNFGLTIFFLKKIYENWDFTIFYFNLILFSLIGEFGIWMPIVYEKAVKVMHGRIHTYVS